MPQRYTWGTEPIIIGRTPLFADLWGSDVTKAEKYVTGEAVGYQELILEHRDWLGNPVDIQDPEEFARRWVEEMRAKGIEPVYIEIQGSRARAIYKGSPIPFVVGLIIVLAAIGVFAWFMTMIIKEWFQIKVLEVPGIGRITLGHIVLGVVGITALALLIRAIRG